MSPESLEMHNKVKTEFTAALARYVREYDLGEVHADRALFTNLPAPILRAFTFAASATGSVGTPTRS